MIAATDDRALAARARRMRAGIYWALGVALVSLLTIITLIEPETGVWDVHIPSAGRSLMIAHQALLQPGEPWIVGPGIGRLPQMLALALHAGTLSAAAFALWALWKRKNIAGQCAIAYVVIVQSVGPIPTTMQPEPPVAVSAATAARLLASEAGDAAPWRRYVRSQIAFTRNDHAAAAALAAGIEAEDLQSPIEAAYRLQHLQGRPITTTATCFAFGCVSAAGRRNGQVIALALLTLGLAAASGAGLLLRMFHRRSQRIGALRAHGLHPGTAT